MRPEEARALGDLLGGAAAGIAAQAGDVHGAIAARVFGALGAPAAPVRLLHDRISGGSYAAARSLSRALVRGGAGAYGLTRGADASALQDGRRGRALVGVVNGAWGDRLDRRARALETPMALRHRGSRVALDVRTLARVYPNATGRLAIFVHGLGETEDAWRRHSARDRPYGERLAAELGYTPLFVRFNSGLHISRNGRALDALLVRLVAAWPVEVAEIALIGHSMGGLVARGACHYAAPGGWRERLGHVVMLGTPHTGALLERAANAACHVLSGRPATRPFAAPVRARSAGTKDLGYGYVVDADWEGHDPDAPWSNTRTIVPYLESANHHFVAATISRDPQHPAGRLLGDLLVRRASAWACEGPGERPQFTAEHYRHLGATNHFDLLNHPVVYAQLRRWLTTGPESESGRRVG